MSYTINGIGTHIYGKENVLTRQDRCTQCGAFGPVSSYDATNYFVVLFIPLIPIGKLRVLDHCPACDRWRQMPRRKWEQAKEEALQAALDGMKADPGSPEAVTEALATATTFQDEGVLLQFGQVAKNFRDNFDVQSMHAATLSYFGRTDESIEAYENALAVKDEPELREQLAVEQMQAGRPDDAEPNLAHIWEGDASKASYAIVQAEAYQTLGDHESAMARIDRVEETWPEVAAAADFKKFRKEAEKLQKKGQPRKVASLQAASTKSGSSVAKWIGPGIAAALFALYLFVAFKRGADREIVLVSGLGIPYSANVAGVDYELEPYGTERIHVSEGEIPVSMSVNGHSGETETISVKTSFFGRPFSSPLFVINPDRTALIEESEIIYSDRNDFGNEEEPNYALHFGDTFYHFSGIEYPFETPPGQIETKSKSAIHKDVVDNVSFQGMSDIDLYNAVYGRLDDEQQTDFLKRRLGFGDVNDVLLGMLEEHIGSESMLPLLKPHLKKRPVDVAIHRVYQNATEEVEPDKPLTQEYEDLLNTDSTNPDLMYLAARAQVDNWQRRENLLKEAARGVSPSMFAISSLAFQHLSEGNFAKGLPLARRATETDPQSASFKVAYCETLQGLGRYDDALQNMVQGDNSSPLSNLQTLAVELPILAAAERRDRAEARLKSVINPLKRQYPGPMVDALAGSLYSTMQYAFGDVEAMRNSAAESTDVPFYIHIELDQLDDASQIVLEMEEPNSESELSMYLAAQLAGNKSMAQSHLDRAISTLGHGTADARLIANALESGDGDIELLVRVPEYPKSKRIMMAALAYRIPAERQRLLDLANRLNYNRSHPYRLLKRIAEKK